MVNINRLKEHLSTLNSYLNDSETKKAHQFYFQPLRDRYIISHGYLRLLLAQYLASSPERITFYFNEYGKPFCTESEKVYFNLSYSELYICYAISRYPVGVDIEFMKDIKELELLLQEVTSLEEITELKKKEPTNKLEIFYKIWTMKEAFLKALGIGLSYPLSKIVTSVFPKGKYSILDFDHNNIKLENEWTFSSIDVTQKYLGAIAINNENEKINTHYLI